MKDHGDRWIKDGWVDTWVDDICMGECMDEKCHLLKKVWDVPIPKGCVFSVVDT